jgi:nitrile hydratase accessory protein
VDSNNQPFGNAIARRVANDISGPAAIPRRNGEPVFNEPWESRVFGAAVVLCERGLFQWDEFRDRLIAEITSSDATHDSSTAPSSYYERFLAALERLLVEKGICAKDEIEQLASAQTTEPHEHG